MVDFLEAIKQAFPDKFAIDVFKAALGSFVGAGLAFWFALRKDHLNRSHAQQTSGRVATTTLARFSSDFFQVKKAIVESRAEVLAAQPRSSLWMQLKPMPFPYAEDLQFDMSAITYIFDYEGGASVFEKLINAQLKYHNFFFLLREHRSTAQEVQDLLAQNFPDPQRGVRVAEVEAKLGFSKVARMNSLVKAIFSDADDGQQTFDQASDALSELLKRIFKKKALRIVKPVATDSARIYPPDVYVRDTGTEKGRGIFAARAFSQHELVEVCPVVVLRVSHANLPNELKVRTFNWGFLAQVESAEAFALGYGSLYNHANPANLEYTADPSNSAMRFTAARAINVDEELTINYNAKGGGAKWHDNNWFERMKMAPLQ